MATRQVGTVVLLDLRGYSKLNAEGQAAVFNEFLPKVYDRCEEQDLLDANTWGDSILAIFAAPPPAARFALGVRTLLVQGHWTHNGLKQLGARIAIHATPLIAGVDAFRAHGTDRKRQHWYGPGLVHPARIEPVVQPENSIWVTEQAAKLLEDSIRQDELSATLYPMGQVWLAKQAGQRLVWWLGERNETAPPGLPVPQLDATERTERAFRSTIETAHLIESQSSHSSPAPKKNILRVTSTYLIHADYSGEIVREYQVKALADLRFYRITIGAEDTSPPLDYVEDADFRATQRKGPRGGKVAHLVSRNEPRRKEILLFFLPSMKKGEERTVRVFYKWEGLFAGLRPADAPALPGCAKPRGLEVFRWDLSKGHSRHAIPEMRLFVYAAPGVGALGAEITGAKTGDEKREQLKAAPRLRDKPRWSGFLYFLRNAPKEKYEITIKRNEGGPRSPERR